MGDNPASSVSLTLPLYLVFRRVPTSAIKPALGQRLRPLGQETAGLSNPGLLLVPNASGSPQGRAVAFPHNCSRYERIPFWPMQPKAASHKTTAADITQATLRAFDNTPDPRLKELFTAAVKHLHGFANDVKTHH